VLTNNRRLVTRSMWFNGTALSDKARRALEKERVTIVSHVSGYTHIEYPEATIDSGQYGRLDRALREFLATDINFEIFANFLRVNEAFRKYFQFEYQHEGRLQYLTAEKLYHYEHNSKNRVGDTSRSKLLEEVETEDFDLEPNPERYTLNVLEQQLNGRPLTCRARETYEVFRNQLDRIPNADELCRRLCAFACTQPSLPAREKTYLATERLNLPLGWPRDQIVNYLTGLRNRHATVDLAFHAARRIREHEWEPYLKACLERNPVSLGYFADRAPQAVFEYLQALPDESIYDGDALATPDEVVNFGRGDGLEKAVCLVNVLKARGNGGDLDLEVSAGRVTLRAGGQSFMFSARKQFNLSRRL